MDTLLKAELTYDQKVVLFLYRTFFLSNYFVDYKNSKDNDVNLAHLKMQKMIYILTVFGIDIGHYSFSWNVRGPYSIDLSNFLKQIERINCDSENEDWESLGLEYIKSDVESLISEFHFREKTDEDGEWIELVSSIMYLSQTVFPGMNKERLFEKLFDRKEKYKMRKNDCCDVWKRLEEKGLIV